MASEGAGTDGAGDTTTAAAVGDARNGGQTVHQGTNSIIATVQQCSRWNLISSMMLLFLRLLRIRFLCLPRLRSSYFVALCGPLQESPFLSPFFVNSPSLAERGGLCSGMLLPCSSTNYMAYCSTNVARLRTSDRSSPIPTSTSPHLLPT